MPGLNGAAATPWTRRAPPGIAGLTDTVHWPPAANTAAPGRDHPPAGRAAAGQGPRTGTVPPAPVQADQDPLPGEVRAPARDGAGHAMVLSPAMRAALLDQAHASAPCECCGILLGTPGDDDAPAQVALLHPAPNPAAAHSLRRFRIGAADVARASAVARARGLEVIGFYHSHPRGVAEPSREDVRDASAWPGYLHIIAAPNDTPALRAYRTGSPRWHELTIL